LAFENYVFIIILKVLVGLKGSGNFVHGTIMGHKPWDPKSTPELPAAFANTKSRC